MADSGALTLTVLGGTGVGVLGYAGALGVGLVFLQAGIAKIRRRELVAGVIANYRLLPGALVTPAALLLAPVELAIALSLLLAGQPLAAAAAIALLLIFAFAMGINIARGRRQIDCGCGRSQLRQPLSWLLVARNIALAVVLLPRFIPGPPPTNADLPIALVGGLALFVIVQLFNAIGALAASPLAAQRR